MQNFLKNPIFWAKFLGYAIPLAVLGYVLYQNYLPFGYDKTFTINVGSENDTQVGEFYLEPSITLSERKIAPDGTHYRELNGLATAVFKPNTILKDATITVETTDPGVSLIPPTIDFDPAQTTWDYSWNFTTSVPAGMKNTKAFVFDNATYFDGSARLELPKTNNSFETSTFSVYAEWMPTDSENDSQQIVGHYNWELSQNKNSVSFQAGRMNDSKGPTYKIHSFVDKDFFNKKHSALAIYNPGDNGYIELYVDGKFADREYFGTSTIWVDYGKNNLTLGKNGHSSSKFFKGALYTVQTAPKSVLTNQSKINFYIFEEITLNIPIIASSNTTFHKLLIHAVQR